MGNDLTIEEILYILEKDEELGCGEIEFEEEMESYNDEVWYLKGW